MNRILPLPGRSRQWVSRTVGMLACLLMFGPGIAFLFTGPGSPLENRARTEFSGLRDGWDSLRSFAKYLNDRLPLRQQAIQLDAWIDEAVFREDPAFGGAANPRVIRGSNGFLFLADAIDAACHPHAPVEETVASLKEFATIVAESGRGVLVAIAPDKSSVHPDWLPDGIARRPIFDEYTNRFWSLLETEKIPGYVDLRAALRESSRQTREPLYLRKDSHWDTAGSLVAVRLAITHFAPALWSEEEVVYHGLVNYTGDLTSMLGHPQVDQAPNYSVQRPDVTLKSAVPIDDIEGGFNRRFINAAEPGRLIPGRTVLFLDSFGLAALNQIIPFFEDLTVMRLVDFNSERWIRLIAESERVWLLSVERSSSYRLRVEFGSREFLDALAREITPGRVH